MYIDLSDINGILLFKACFLCFDDYNMTERESVMSIRYSKSL